jgi:hypothetical protein
MDKTMKIAIILTAMDKMSSVVNNAVNRTQKKLKSFETGLNHFGNKAFIAGGLGTAFFGETIKLAEESEKAANIARQIWSNMGDKTGEAFRQAEESAIALAPKIGVVHEKIEAVTSQLAIFTKVSDEQARKTGIFQNAIIAAYNAQALGFGDAESNIKRFGMALQDPAQYLERLARAGIYFSKQQKEQIKNLQLSGHLHKAQEMILGQLQKRFGKVARAAVNESERARVAWHERMVQIGTKLLPIFNRVATWFLDKAIPAITAFIDKHPKLVRWLAIASVALLVMGAAAKVLAFGIFTISSVVGIASKAFTYLGQTIVFIGRLFLGCPILLIIAAIAVAVYLVIKNWSKIRAFFIRLWDGIKNFTRAAWKIILAVILAPFKAIIWLWNKISAFFLNIWNGIVGIAKKIWKAIGDAITAPIVWIQKKWDDFREWFKKLWEDIQNMAKSMQYGQGKGLEFAKSASMANAGGGGSLNVFNSSPTPALAPRAGNSSISLNYSPTINGAAGETGIMNMLKGHQQDMLKMITEAQRKNNRTKFN